MESWPHNADDALTGLFGRKKFNQALERALASSDKQVVLMYLVIDHFKRVNDIFGYATGDQLLRNVSERLVACLRSYDIVGRLGGDEFGLILPMSNGIDCAPAVAKKLHAALQSPFSIDCHSVRITVSIGVTVQNANAANASTILKQADAAMCRAKNDGRNTFRISTPQMGTELSDKMLLEAALQGALDRNEFILYYQPKLRLDTGLVSGVEALLRWKRPSCGVLPPSAFIPALERLGLIAEVGAWVQRETCRQIAEWCESAIGPIQVSVNVSSRQFIDGDLEANVLEALQMHGVRPSLLELELTESSLMVDTGKTIATLRNLQRLGVQVSIDDFGTGYSSLAYLQRFPINKLKLDIEFTNSIRANSNDAFIAIAIINMAKGLRLPVIAEGVETLPQLHFLRSHGCHEIQGFVFSRPLLPNQMAELVERTRRRPWKVSVDRDAKSFVAHVVGSNTRALPCTKCLTNLEHEIARWTGET